MALTLDGTNGITFPDSTVLGTGLSLGIKNRLINGEILVDQRNSGSSQTITAGAALAYTVDRWYAYCTGANVTGQQVSNTGTSDSPSLYAYRFTGAASVTAIGFAQRIESRNCYDLAGETATLSVNLANSLLTTVTWTAYYATTTDTFGTLASPTKTQIATGSFTVTSTMTRYSTQISVPSAATTGIEIVFTVGSQTSGTWTIGNVQLEPGSEATTFERRLISDVVKDCKRYFSTASTLAGGFNGAGTYTVWFYSEVSFRAQPTISYTGTMSCIAWGVATQTTTTQPTVLSWNPNTNILLFQCTGVSGSTVSGFGQMAGQTLKFNAEL